MFYPCLEGDRPSPTGLCDKDGNRIFEGSVMQAWFEDVFDPEGGFWHKMYVVYTLEKGFVLWGERMTMDDAEPLHETLQREEWRVVGDVRSMPEVLKYDLPNE